MSQKQPVYPLTIKGELTEPLSRGLWIVKWLLGIPHFIVLAALWVAAIVVTVIAFFAIVFTGKYPKGLFNFVVGVMRWTWRVGFWSYEVLGTDKYPPFTLEPVADYPADLNVEYPAKLSQGLVWIKWWLLAIPHYIIVAFFQGGGHQWRFGLVHVISIFAGVGVLFTGRYQPDFFKFAMGMNRWSYRVLAYALLMTDKYPPFSLD
ncbi:MAG: DUF4389 domain-containing protein [Dehalococcoidia bacterium]